MIIEYCDEKYPDNLREILKPPSRIYALGNINLLDSYGIAVVGSRTNTEYGEKMCEFFTKGLVEYGLNIISGLAIGIDSIAHETALKYSGNTVAVLPSGLNNIYPSVNKELARRILKNDGTIISEYSNETKADSNKFRERNRLIAGLAIGTLVIEAGIYSGTSITARITKSLNKNVFALPSNLDSKKGKTTNELIKKGAKLVTCVEDIINEYPELKLIKREKNKKVESIQVSKELKDVYNCILKIPKDINTIARELNRNINEINYKIMMLELDDKIQELPGQRFIVKEEVNDD